MKRQELNIIMGEEMTRVKNLFAEKNYQYGSEVDVFLSFKETSRRMYQSDDKEDMYTVLYTLADKHWIPLANLGMNDKDYTSRLRDIILYCILAIAMKKLENKEGESF